MRGLGAAELNLFDLFAKISLDTSEYDSGVKDVTKSGSSLASKLKSGLASAGKVAAAGIGAVTAAAGAAVGGLLALEQSTEEYRRAMGRLNTAFETAGYGADVAQEAYRGFYGILGDTDTATEASQLLAQLADSAEDVSVWTNIAAGVNGTFGDSLPIEGLIEAANETANVGTVTGVLADALNWVGISEDEFNEKLAKCSSESERNQLIMETLAGQYDEAADAFYRNNEALVESRNAQAQMDAVLAQLGQTVSNIRSQLTAEFLPSIANVATAFNNMLNGAEGADQQFALAVEDLVAVAVEKLPEFLDFGVQIIMALVNGIVASIPSLVTAVPQIVAAIAEAVIELLPQILDVGVQLLDQFATGIETELPNMVARLPQVIEAILNFITENLPAFLEKGVEILSKIMYGIIEAIPILVENLPQIIQAITEFFVENFPKIVAAGGELLWQLLVGLIGAIPEIAVQIPNVITALVEAFEAGWEQLKQAGAYLLEGLWAGIGDKITWLKSKVSSVVDTIKSWFTGSEGFDEHSPSKWSRQVFKYIMDGGAEGLDDGLSGVMQTVRSVGNTIKNGMDFGSASIGFENSGMASLSRSVSTASRANFAGRDFVFNLTTELDGQILSRKQYKYNQREALLRGGSLVGG